MPLSNWRRPPLSLLVSVRSTSEAAAALAGGAEVIDVKEPARGALGRADAEVVRSIARLVDGRRPVTAAAGDLGELAPAELAAWADESTACLVKVGVSLPATQSAVEMLTALRGALPPRIGLAPALYADADHAPPDARLLARLQAAASARWLVVDTADKSGPALTGLWRCDQLSQLIGDAGRAGLRLVLAGGVTAQHVATFGASLPDLLGVRGAVCEGGRGGLVREELVAEFAAAAATARRSHALIGP